MPDGLSTKIKEYNDKLWSIRAISTHLHISQNTVLRYLDKRKFTPQALGYIKSCERKRKGFMNLDPVSITKISEKDARLYAALLYWCEGSKYPASSSLSFTTTDVQMQKLFLALLRRGFKPIESKFRVWLQIHREQSKEKLFAYWSSNLRIPESQFFKPSITDKKGKRYRRVYYGTCSLRYSDYSLILRLMGIYQRFYQQALHALI